jgi:UPF0176 protein
MNYRILLFYKYVDVQNPELMVEEHLKFCFSNGIKGRVYIAEEGINGTVSGEVSNTELYKAFLRNYPGFEDIWFKEDEAAEHAFTKTHIKVKHEIVHSDLEDTSLENGGKRLQPEELLKFYEEGKDFIIVDARNWYEAKIGKFKNAIDPELKTFRDWKNVADRLHEYKDKTVVTYCTGGIRCEKASAFLVEKGFKDVYQLEGGIINYVKQFPDSYWEGAVWVFDERRMVEPNSKEELKRIGECYFCGTKTSWYINCHNLDCDKIMIVCNDCKTKNDYCCSDLCRSSENKRNRYFG